MSAQTPAVIDNTPTVLGQLTLLDDVERVMRLPVGEVRALAIDVVHAGAGLLKAIKRAAGVCAMAMRAKTSDRDYGDWAHDYCALLGIDPVTLKRWREDEEHRRGVKPTMTRNGSGQKPRSEARNDILSTSATPPPNVAGGRGPDAEAEAQPLPSARATTSGAGPVPAPGSAPKPAEGAPAPAPATAGRPSRASSPSQGAPLAPPAAVGESGTGATAPVAPKSAAAGTPPKPSPLPALRAPASIDAFHDALVTVANVPDGMLRNADQLLVAKARQKLNAEWERRAAFGGNGSSREVEPRFRKAGKL